MRNLLKQVTFISFLGLAASAYQIVIPNSFQGWTNDGPQSVAWTRVETDPDEFDIVFYNQDSTITPVRVLLAESVDGDEETLEVEPPSGGWPTGDGFRIALTQSDGFASGILAESGEFNITNSVSTTSRSTATTRTASSAATSTVSADSLGDEANGGYSLSSMSAIGIMGAATSGLLVLLA